MAIIYHMPFSLPLPAAKRRTRRYVVESIMMRGGSIIVNITVHSLVSPLLCMCMILLHTCIFICRLYSEVLLVAEVYILALRRP